MNADKKEYFCQHNSVVAVTNDTCRLMPGGHGSQVVKVSDRDWRVTSSSPVPLKTRHVEERSTLNLSRAQTSSR
ncbi:hypothetical protein TNCV_4014581 [Trichonephila clavipes]|uniref:Uncharacterized protein n=1 Tax=Trichonephila clavipes TaxID=2585209 RepID=A0A8X6V4I3_TRICX|nr:hypothetical protein TNCV_4014581 [Trichonephila clavipes]